MTRPLQGKSALVTGATRGIGRAIAERLVAEGAEVMATGTRRGGNVPRGCTYVRADFTDEDEPEKLAELVAQAAPDIIVNNAGINRIAPFDEILAEDFQAIQKVNLFTPFLLCRAALPAMKEKGWGRIVNIGSVWGKVGKELRASYSASKFGLSGMTAALAAEVAEYGILANCVAPGVIETDLTRTVLDAAQLEALIADVPAGRLGSPQEVAALVAWLAGPENKFVTGQNIAIDGGMTRV